MNIEIGNYARCGTAGIKKIINIIKNPKSFKVEKIIDEEGWIINIKYIQKVSEDKLGIIEEGDYVNGEKVKMHYESGELKIPKTINDILTKEQFNSKKYVFKED